MTVGSGVVFMHVAAILVRWIDVLAAVLFAWREAWRTRRSLVVSRENDRFIVWQAQPGRGLFNRQAESQGIPLISSIWRIIGLVTPRDWAARSKHSEEPGRDPFIRQAESRGIALISSIWRIIGLITPGAWAARSKHTEEPGRDPFIRQAESRGIALISSIWRIIGVITPRDRAGGSKHSEEPGRDPSIRQAESQGIPLISSFWRIIGLITSRDWAARSKHSEELGRDPFMRQAESRGIALISSFWRIIGLITPRAWAGGSKHSEEPGRDPSIRQAEWQAAAGSKRSEEPDGVTCDVSLSADPAVPDGSPPPPTGGGIRTDNPERSPAGSVLAVLSAGTPASNEVVRAARSGFVVLELPADNVVVRRISVPTQAREFLPGIVRNQIERLSPWQVGQAVYGFDAKLSQEDAAVLEVRVLITSRAVVDGARAELDAVALPVDRIVAREGGAQAAVPVALWSRLADAPRVSVERARRRIGAAIAAFVLVSIGLSVWAFSSAASIHGESEDLAARARTLQRQLQGSGTPQAMGSLGPAERAWFSKETSPSVVIVLEVLSRMLPDAAYLTELHLANTTLRIIGLASDTPSLIAPLERSGHLADVHFFAPTTRGPDGKLFRFHIEARVVPRLEITEN
jgi:general secretion pathway protein L